jgi:hypothetical protein
MMTDTAADDPVVQNPTWTGNIQGFFDAGEIACMNAQGIDLSSYDSVKGHSTDIYEQTKSGNMPLGGTPWTANRVQTFLNWINTGFPYGSAAESPASGGAAGTGGSGGGGGDDPVVPHPTYLGNIRSFFRPKDIGCMKPRGIDLSTYAGVKAHATNIYVQTKSGNMPAGGPRWSANRVQTFFNWIIDKCPLGTSETGTAPAAPASASARLRKNVNALSSDEIAALKTAFEGIMALDPTNPNSYFYIASVHGLPLAYCMHHVDTYNPWHRVYVTRFEDALRSIAGCENVTLPYWDITETTVPALLGEAPFNSYTVTQNINDPNYTIPYTTVRNTPDAIISNLASYGVTAQVEQALGQPLFGQYQVPQGYSQPVIYAHDNGHNSCGDTMSDQDVASYDPIFWFFHCNWERVFWSWQVNAGATTLPGFTSTLNGDTDWLGLALDPYSDTTNDIIPYTEVAYDQLAGGGDQVLKTQFGHVDALRAFTIPASAPVSVRVKDIDRMNIPGTFVVHLLADGETIAKQSFFQPKAPRNCSNCRKQSLVSIDFKVDQQKIQGRKMSVQIEVPSLGREGMGAFPLSSAGNPTINARLLLEESA